MKTELVVLKGKEPRAGTFIMSQGFRVEHRALRKLVLKYKSEFEEFGVITSRMQKPTNKKGGRPIEEFLLNEDQAIYLGTLLTNNEAVRKFKRNLVKEFSRVKKTLINLMSQKQNAEWLEQRKAGKLIRKQSTDDIKAFVDYAIAQGSQSAQKYYMNISKMENQALFLVEQKFPNLRDILDLNQLSIVVCADKIISRALSEGIEKGLPYKQIYQLAKLRVTNFADIHGKTVIPSAIKAIGQE